MSPGLQRILSFAASFFIVAVFTYVFLLPSNSDESEPVILESVKSDDFDSFPLEYWVEVDDIGRKMVQIRYRVDRQKTVVWVRDADTDMVVHQSRQYSPKKNGNEYIRQHAWRLYPSFNSIEIPPGEYIISLGGPYKHTYNYEINIFIGDET